MKIESTTGFPSHREGMSMPSTNYRQEQDQGTRETPASRRDVESAILRVVDQRGSCTLDELLLALTDCTFSLMLGNVDRLSRERKVLLRRPTRFGYLVSALLPETHSQQRS